MLTIYIMLLMLNSSQKINVNINVNINSNIVHNFHFLILSGHLLYHNNYIYKISCHIAMCRSTKTGPNCTSARWHFSLPMQFCNNILTSHAFVQQFITLLLLWLVSWACWHARVPGWLQMALVAVHKQTLGCKPHKTANWCYPLIWLLFVALEVQMDHCWGHFRESVTVHVVCLAHHFVAPYHSHHPIEITCGIASKMVGNSATQYW